MRQKNEALYDQILECVNSYFEQNGRSPSMREIEALTGISRWTVQRYLAELQERGVIEYGGARSIVTPFIRELQETTRAVIGSSIPCGPMSDAVTEDLEYIRMPVALTGQGEFFILRTKGDSMINAGIDSGDLVLIRKQETALEGQIVAVLYQDYQTTLKRYHRVSDKEVHLIPENDDMEPIVIKGNDLQDLIIQGVAVMALKDLES